MHKKFFNFLNPSKKNASNSEFIIFKKSNPKESQIITKSLFKILFSLPKMSKIIILKFLYSPDHESNNPTDEGYSSFKFFKSILELFDSAVGHANNAMVLSVKKILNFHDKSRIKRWRICPY